MHDTYGKNASYLIQRIKLAKNSQKLQYVACPNGSGRHERNEQPAKQ